MDNTFWVLQVNECLHQISKRRNENKQNKH